MNRRIAARFFAEMLLAACAACALSPAAADDLLAPEQAFRFSARLIEPGLVELRYRIADGGALTMWYELLRPHKILEDAAHAVWTEIQDKTGLTVFNGKP